MRLLSYIYVYIYISGKENVRDDLLEQRASPDKICRLVHFPALPSALEKSFVWPCQEEALKQQERYAQERMDNMILQNGLWYTSAEGQVWTPNDASYIQHKLCVIAHTSAAEHHGAKSAKKLSDFSW